jgi:hypothetical protein
MIWLSIYGITPVYVAFAFSLAAEFFTDLSEVHAESSAPAMLTTMAKLMLCSIAVCFMAVVSAAKCGRGGLPVCSGADMAGVYSSHPSCIPHDYPQLPVHYHMCYCSLQSEWIVPLMN